MLTTDLLNNNIPQLKLQDSVSKALQLINDFKITHLPVVADEHFLGLISENDLLDAEDDQLAILVLQEQFIPAVVKESVHFLNAVNYSNQYESTIVPVVNDQNIFLGVITVTDLLKTLGEFSGASEIGGIIVLEMERVSFAISEISRIVESNDATILHLNTTTNSLTGLLTVTLHLNKREIAAIIAAFERYEYQVVYHFGNVQFESDIKSNYQHLMTYLDI
jgi:CBS domain-containing protein